MKSDIKIYLSGYYWASSGRQYYKSNFFNKDITNLPLTYLSRIEVTNDVIELSNISYTFGGTTQENVPKYYRESSDFSFTLNDIEKNKSITVNLNGTKTCKSYREIFLMYVHTANLKFVVDVVYKGSVIYTGLIKEDGFKDSKTTKSDSDRIRVECVGIEKELKEYHSNVKLSELTINYTSFTDLDVIYQGENNNNSQEVQAISLYDFMQNFTTSSIGINVKTDIRNVSTEFNFLDSSVAYQWYLSKRQFLCPINTALGQPANTPFCKCGFDRLIEQGETLWGWLEKFSNAMGWKFQIVTSGSITSPIHHLKLSNHYNDANDITTITESEIIGESGISILKSIPQSKLYGTFTNNGSYDFLGLSPLNNPLAKGSKMLMVTLYDDVRTLSDPFKFLFQNSIHYNTIPQTTYNLNSNNDQIIDWAEVTNNTVSFAQMDRANDFLYLDTGNANKTMRYDWNSGIHVDSQTLGESNGDFLFTGNYGTMAFYKKVRNPYVNFYVNYQDYAEGSRSWVRSLFDTGIYGTSQDTYRKNMLALLKHKLNISTEIVYNEVLTNPFNTIKLETEIYNTALANNIFNIDEMEIDLINDTTKLKLQGVN